MAPGEHGAISQLSSGGRHFASTYVRDADGKRRRVQRSSSKSPEDARRLLQRHLARRTAPTSCLIGSRTTLAELFDAWIDAKVIEDGVSQQTADQYRDVWRVHGANQLGALRIGELPTSRADAHLRAMGPTTQAKRLQMILRGMFSLAVRFDALAVNPIRETKTTATARKPVRAATAAEFAIVRESVRAYAEREGPGPHPGRLLPAFVDLLAATGARPNEVLALRWPDVDLPQDDGEPTVTLRGTLIDHGRITGKPLHRQEYRKGGAPEHTVVLPGFGVEALMTLAADGPRTGPVFANRNGGWISLANMRRCLRAALPEDLRWITPHSFRRTVATVVRDALGPEKAQQQLSHSKLSTTEAHYLERHTHGPDVRSVLDVFAGQQSGN